jgi:hypothetical protein
LCFRTSGPKHGIFGIGPNTLMPVFVTSERKDEFAPATKRSVLAWFPIARLGFGKPRRAVKKYAKTSLFGRRSEITIWCALFIHNEIIILTSNHSFIQLINQENYLIIRRGVIALINVIVFYASSYKKVFFFAYRHIKGMVWEIDPTPFFRPKPPNF